MPPPTYQVIARKYRPQIFDAVAGQEHITGTLKNALQFNRVAHAYLFTGPRGVGKTTTARILAKTLNCVRAYPEAPCNECTSCREITAGLSMNVIEIDGASNRGIDHIRDLRENIKYAPSSGRYKIYIIDEVHMLTTEAFNALLKTLEEPPEHAKFFFATTEIQKVPATILSRCQRFDFRLLGPGLVADQLQGIAEKEDIRIDRESLLILARYSGGSMRDAQSFFDQLIAYAGSGEITAGLVREFLGVVSSASIHELLEAAAQGDLARGLAVIASVIESGHNLTQFIDDLILVVRTMMLCKAGAGQNAAEFSKTELDAIGALAAQFGTEQILYMLNILMKDRQQFKNAFSERVFLEVLFAKLSRIGDIVAISELMGRVEAAPAAAATPPPVMHDPAPRSAPATVAEPRAQAPYSPAPAAPAKKPVPAETAAPASGLEEGWKRLLQTLNAAQPLLGAYLGQGTPRALEGGKLAVEFAAENTFYIEQLQNAKNAEAVREALKKSIAGAEDLVCRVQEESAPAAPGAARPQAAATPEKREMEELAQHPHVSKLLKLTGGKIVTPSPTRKDPAQ